ncbi:MAG: hypothetical protein RIS47_1708, partial [Bacteroidota bacterium]
MNTNIINNYSRLKFSLFILPLFLFIAIFVYLYSQDALSAEKYAQIQKNSFIFLNLKLSQFPILEYNLTQLGDALIILSLLSVFLVSAPKMWESLLTGSIVSGVFSNVLKRLFAVPRPAQAFGSDNIVIIGKTLSGFNSLPSGHSITIFTTLT